MMQFHVMLNLFQHPIKKTLKQVQGDAQYWMACCCLLLFTAASQAQEWTLKKDEDGIKVYTRLPEGKKLEEVRATVRIKTSLSAFTALLKDVPGYKDWAYNCVESKVLKIVCDTAQCYYTQTDLPWPVSNRDLIFRSSLKQDEKTLVISTNSVCMPEMLDESEDVVRIREGRTAWTLVPLAGGYVDVDYYASIDPGGSVPTWVINSTIDKGPYNTLKKVRELLEGGLHKDATFWFVKELGQ
jgi:hypothetical protein